MDEKIQRLLSWSLGNPQGPYTLEIWPTFRCNLNCVFCAHDFQRKNSPHDYSYEITPERWLEIIDEAKRLNVREIRLVGGGEPMVNPKSSLLMTKIKEYGMQGSITTNGTLFDENLIKNLVALEWDRIEFSIDGPNAEINDYLRGKRGVFDKTVKTLKLFHAYKKKLNKNKPELFFSTVLTNLNFDKIDKMIDLAGSVGCKQIILLSLNMDTPACEKLKLSQSQMKKFSGLIPELKNKSSSLGLDLCTDMVDYQGHIEVMKKEDFILPDLNDRLKFLELPCFEPWYYMQVKEDGRVSPCCCGFCNRDDKERLATKSLEYLWFNGHLKHVRDALMNKKLIGDCSFCNTLNLHRSNEIRSKLIEAYLNIYPQEKPFLEELKQASEKIFGSVP